METKTKMVRDYVSKGEYKKALAILKTFRMVSCEDKRVYTISYEILCGSDAFYRQIGINTDELIEKSIVLMKNF
jgi:hypothetical protein